MLPKYHPAPSSPTMERWQWRLCDIEVGTPLTTCSMNQDDTLFRQTHFELRCCLWLPSMFDRMNSVLIFRMRCPEAPPLPPTIGYLLHWRPQLRVHSCDGSVTTLPWEVNTQNGCIVSWKLWRYWWKAVCRIFKSFDMRSKGRCFRSTGSYWRRCTSGLGRCILDLGETLHTNHHLLFRLKIRSWNVQLLEAIEDPVVRRGGKSAPWPGRRRIWLCWTPLPGYHLARGEILSIKFGSIDWRSVLNCSHIFISYREALFSCRDNVNWHLREVSRSYETRGARWQHSS